MPTDSDRQHDRPIRKRSCCLTCLLCLCPFLRCCYSKRSSQCPDTLHTTAAPMPSLWEFGPFSPTDQPPAQSPTLTSPRNPLPADSRPGSTSNTPYNIFPPSSASPEFTLAVPQTSQKEEREIPSSWVIVGQESPTNDGSSENTPQDHPAPPPTNPLATWGHGALRKVSQDP